MIAPSGTATTLLGGLFVALAALGARAAWLGSVPLVLAGYLALWAAYALVVHRGVPSRAALVTALLSGLVLVLAPPILSDDVHRYLWDARVAMHGIDPYAYAPADPALDALDGPLRAAVSYPEIPTIYPPIAQLAFVIARALGEAPWAMQLVALALHLATGALLRARSERAAALFWLCPLGLWESAGAGHVDVLAGLFLLVGAMRLGRPLSAAVAFALATGTKLVGLLALPLLRGRALALGLGLSVLLAAPIFFAGHASGATAGVSHYARRWQGTGPVFPLIERATAELLRPLAAEDGTVPFPLARPLATLLPGTALDPHAEALGAHAPADRSRVRRSVLAAMIARVLVLGAVLALAIARCRGQRSARSAARALRDVLIVALVLSPQIHPWYLLWALPLELFAGGVVVRALAATSVLAYLPLASFRAGGPWIEPGWLAPLLLAVLALAVRFERPDWRSAAGPNTPPACAVRPSPSSSP